MSSQNTHWQNKHKQYAATDWINMPSIFAEFAITHFPTTGKILELGAGQGQDSRFFAEKGYQVTSTDRSEEALKLNLEKIPTELKSKIEVVNLDMEEPFPFEDETFEVVYSHLSLHYFADMGTRKIFAEISRVLKPGGIVAILVNSVNDPEYGVSTKIEDDYFENDGVRKRFFSKGTIATFASDFEIILADENGETYKDSAKGVHNLVRFVGRKR